MKCLSAGAGYGGDIDKTDVYTPMEFFEIAGALASVIGSTVQRFVDMIIL